MTEQTNPAQRLIEIFTAAQSQQHPFLTGWAFVFELISPPDRGFDARAEADTLEHLVQLSRYVDEVEQKVRDARSLTVKTRLITPRPSPTSEDASAWKTKTSGSSYRSPPAESGRVT